MEWQQLEYFCETAKMEHITRAAEKLHISQPSLSTAIRRLELELGVRLFDRQGRSIKLNRYGEAFLAKVEPALKLLEDGRQELRAMASDAENRIMISTPSLYSDPAIMKHLLTQHPNLVINQIYVTEATLVQMLKNNKLDFCVTSLELNDEQVNCENLRSEDMMLLVSGEHPLAKRTEIRLADCRNELFITDIAGSAYRKNLERCCRAAGFVPKCAYEGAGIRDVMEAVSQGICVAMVPEPALATNMASDVRGIRIVDPSYSITLKMYWPKNKAERRVVSSVRQIIMEHFR